MKKLSCLFFLATIAAFGQTLPSYVPGNGLVGWWPFNGNANDQSGNGYNFNVFGPALSTDRWNNLNSAYIFNGTQSNAQYLQLSPIPSGINNSHSISIWFETTSFYPNQQPLNPWDFNNFNCIPT